MGDHRVARRVLCVVGTRPEAVKVAPVIWALDVAEGWQPVAVATGQHGDLATDVLAVFGLDADIVLNDWRRDGELADLYPELLSRLARVVVETDPDVVLVQGDTASTFAGALAGFWARVPVVHLEAGLRTGSLAEPFPEEANRRMIGQIASLHLAPTEVAERALVAENIDPGRVLVIGNTVVDAVRWLAATRDCEVGRVDGEGRRLVLVTCHRRENWGEGVRRVAVAVRELAERFGDCDVVVSAHPNPAVREVLDAHLGDAGSVRVLDAPGYGAFIESLSRASVVLTDSGGVQEEAAALGIPAVVLRGTTERREGVELGVAELVGTDPGRIVRAVSRILDGRPAGDKDVGAWCPYGDGQAARRTVEALGWLLEGTAPPDRFVVGRQGVGGRCV